jgi:dephospho-CoA kinase
MKQQMKWVGLTGGIASGKSTVARLFRERGIPVVDADQIAREVTRKDSPGLESVLSHFGRDLVDLQGNLDRKKLGRVVFADKAKLKELENILHPEIRAQTARLKKQLQEQGHSVAIYDVPLLFEKNMMKDFDAIIVVTAVEAEQIRRLKERDRLGDQEIQDRLRAQLPMAHKEQQAHYVIKNDGSIEDLEKSVRQVLVKLQSGKA